MEQLRTEVIERVRSLLSFEPLQVDVSHQVLDTTRIFIIIIFRGNRSNRSEQSVLLVIDARRKK